MAAETLGIAVAFDGPTTSGSPMEDLTSHFYPQKGSGSDTAARAASESERRTNQVRCKPPKSLKDPKVPANGQIRPLTAMAVKGSQVPPRVVVVPRKTTTDCGLQEKLGVGWGRTVDSFPRGTLLSRQRRCVDEPALMKTAVFSVSSEGLWR